jgi:maltoporin
VGGFYQKDTYKNGTKYKQSGEKYTIALGLADGPTLCHVLSYACLLLI